MKCEGTSQAKSAGPCRRQTEGYELFDYCEKCSKNLCPHCMTQGRCSPTGSDRGGGHHIPANHGGDTP